MELLEAVNLAAGGDALAQRELYRQFRPAVARLVEAFSTLDGDEVDDVVQETFIRAFTALPALRDPRSFQPWLYSIARNRARSRLETKGAGERAVAEIARQTPSVVDAFPEALQAERDEEIVRQLIAELPEGAEKDTVRLFYVEGGLSARQIAERLGVGKSAVTMRLERFRGKVKRALLQRVLAVRR